MHFRCDLPRDSITHHNVAFRELQISVEWGPEGNPNIKMVEVHDTRMVKQVILPLDFIFMGLPLLSEFLERERDKIIDRSIG